jgi:hypothetical protein
MREEGRAVISLPDRLAHVWEAKLDASPASAPSILEYFSHDVRQGSTGSYASDIDSRSCCSFSSHSPDRDDRQSRGNHAINLSFKCFDATAQSDTSLMPEYESYQGLEHSGRLLSQMPIGNHLLPQVTMRPAAKLSEIQEGSTARKIANLQQQVFFRGGETPNDLLLYPEPSEETGDIFDCSAASPAICLRQRTVAPEMSCDAEECTKEEGEEHTLGDWEDTIGFDSSLSSSLSEESVTKKQPSPPWLEQELLQPSLHQDPTGLMFAFDRMLDCFDRPQDLNASPQTLDTSYSHYVDDEIPDFDYDDIDCFLPCWHDDLEEFADLDKSTMETEDLQFNESGTAEGEDLQELQSKDSLVLESDDSDSFLEMLLKRLELEPEKVRDDVTVSTTRGDKYDWGDETVATEGDSTLISTL